MQILKWIFLIFCLLVVGFFGAAFVVLNQVVVEVNLLFVSVDNVVLGVWLTVFFIAGGLVGLLVSMAFVFREKVARLRLERRMKNSSKLITSYSS